MKSKFFSIAIIFLCVLLLVSCRTSKNPDEIIAANTELFKEKLFELDYEEIAHNDEEKLAVLKYLEESIDFLADTLYALGIDEVKEVTAIEQNQLDIILSIIDDNGDNYLLFLEEGSFCGVKKDDGEIVYSQEGGGGDVYLKRPSKY